MNRILKSVVLMMAVITTFGSCVKNDTEPYTDDPVEIYKVAFKAYIGGEVHPNQKWGFANSSAVRTRASEKATVEINNEDYTDVYTKTFMETVMSYFPEGEECTSKDYLSYELRENATYSRVHLTYTKTDASDEIGLYYYDPKTETYEDKTEIKMIDNIQDNLSYYFKWSQYDSGSMWRTDQTPSDGYALWTDKGAKRIISRTFTIKMNASYYFGFYVRNHTTNKTYYSNCLLNDNKEIAGGLVDFGDTYPRYVIGLSDDGQPSCEILFAMPKRGEDGLYPTPVKPEPKPLEWTRIIAEDLNITKNSNSNESESDFDFNDIILDVALTKTGASCILQAAGATNMIRINGDDNLEVHKLFGVAGNVMVNTDAEKHGLNGASKDPVEFNIEGIFSSIDKIKIEVYKNNEWIELAAPEGDAACKIAVGTDFEWTYERQSLKAKYPDFPKYAKDNVDIETWWKKF